MEASQPSKNLIILVGLPGAGKSTLARSIQSQLDNLDLIEFDQLEFELKSGGDGVFDPIKWQESRQKAFTRAVESTAKYVLLDDNFYYRSMRKPYYQLAREHAFGYLEIHLNTSLELSLERNAQRTPDQRVPDHIIHLMATRLEPPAYPLHTHITTPNQDILKHILAARALSPLSDNHKPTESETQTFLHTVDQALRKALSEVLAEYPGLRARAKEINEARVVFYGRVKKEGVLREYREGEIGEREALERIKQTYKNEVIAQFKVVQ